MSNIGRGIPISVGFDLGADMPLDARSTVEKKSDLNTLVAEGIACYGLTVFVLEDETYHQYLGNNMWDEIGRLEKVESLIRVTADEIRTEIKDLENNTNTKIEQTADEIRGEVNDVNNGLSSKIEQTANAIRSEVKDTNNNLSSSITQTTESITSKIENLEAGLNSKIEQTTGAIRSEVNNTANELNSKIEQTAGAIRSEVSNTANELNSKIEQTAGTIRSEVNNTVNGLNSKIEQTAGAIRSEVSNAVNGINSKITQTESQIRAEIKTVDDKLASSITQTADAIRTEIRNADTNSNSKIEQIASQIRSEVSALDNKLSSSITQTSTSVTAQITDLQNNLNSRITQTAGEIRSEVEAVDNKLTSSISQTASAIRSEVKTADDKLASSITQTAEEMNTKMTAMDNKLTSSITQTATSLTSQINDYYLNTSSAITQTAKEIRTEIADVDKSLHSSLTQTAALLRVEMEDLEKDTINIIEAKTDLFRTEIKDNKEQLESQIKQTSSEIRAEITNKEKNLDSKIEQTATAIRSEVTDASNATNSRITQTANAIRQELTDVNNGLSSRITQTTQDLTAMFQDGYEFGITRVNKDGVRVMHSGYNGYTEMKATGFYVNDGKENVVSITKDGSIFKGKVYMNGGQVPSDYISGTLKAGQIAADSITSTHIKAGAINADNIAAGAITSNKLSADAITGKTITGGSITGATISNGNGTFSVDANGNLTAKSATISGTITGSTFTSNDDGFKVLDDGTVKINSLTVDELITTEGLNVTTINNSKYPKVMDRATTVYINSSATSATSWYHEATYSSVSEMLAYAPRNLNGYTLSITLNSDINENVSLSWFHSGQVNFNFNGHTINGYFYAYGASMVYRLYGGVKNGKSVGKVMPYTGSKEDGYYYAIEFMYCQFLIDNIAVYSDITNKSAEKTSSGILAHHGCKGVIVTLIGEGDLRHLVSSQTASMVYVRKTSGMTNNTTFHAYSGGIITINSDTLQAGRKNLVGDPYWAGGGGSILCNQALGMDMVQFKDVANTGTPNTNPNTNTTVTITEKVKATSADTYRSTVYNNWKGDGTCRQGDYGYGDCQGCWFFGNSLYSIMNAGTVTKVVIRIKRQSGGVAALQTMTVKSHNHIARPSGAPTYTNTIGTCSCAVGSAIDLIITDTATINKLKACKGLGLSIGSTSSPYIVCSGNCEVIITYKITSKNA